MTQQIRNALAGWLLGIRITGPELRALADKIEPQTPSQQWAQGYDTGRTRGLIEGRGIGGSAPQAEPESLATTQGRGGPGAPG